MSMILKAVLIFLLLSIGAVIAYALGRTSPGKFEGEIIITDSEDPKYAGRVHFMFEEDIEDLIQHKYVCMRVKNQMSKKYNCDNGEPKFKGKG